MRNSPYHQLTSGVLFACLLNTASALAADVRLQIIHINDTHSHFDADPAQVKLRASALPLYTEIGGLPRLASYIEKLQQKARSFQQPTLFLHGGDAFKGTGYFEVHKETINSDLLSRIGVQAMALGNHEFDAGLDALARFSQQASFPLLAANVDTSEEPLLANSFSPYVLFKVEKGQLKPVPVLPDNPSDAIAVIGVALQDMPQISTQTGKLKFSDEVTSTQHYIDMLQLQGVSKIILLTHLGFERDLQLAAALNGVDVVVGGHSHSYLADLRAFGKGHDTRYATTVHNKNKKSKACVVTAGQYTHLVGTLEVIFDHLGHVTSCEGGAKLLSSAALFQSPLRDHQSQRHDPVLLAQLRALPDTTVEPEASFIRDLIDTKYKPAVQARYGDKITVLPQGLRHVRLPGSEGSDGHGSRLAPVIAQAMLDYVNRADVLQVTGRQVDIALVGAGGIRSSLEAGDVFEGNILMEVLPYKTALSLLEISGKELQQLLDSTIQATLPAGAHAGKYPYTAGLRYVANEIQPGLVQFDQLQVYQKGHWQDLVADAQYQLVTTQYLADGNDGWQILAQTQLQQTNRLDLALSKGQLLAFGVVKLQEQSLGHSRTYQPLYRNSALQCNEAITDLNCGTQNQAVLDYFRRTPLVLADDFNVTLIRVTR